MNAIEIYKAVRMLSYSRFWPAMLTVDLLCDGPCWTENLVCHAAGTVELIWTGHLVGMFEAHMLTGSDEQVWQLHVLGVGFFQADTRLRAFVYAAIAVLEQERKR